MSNPYVGGPPPGPPPYPGEMPPSGPWVAQPPAFGSAPYGAPPVGAYPTTYPPANPTYAMGAPREAAGRVQRPAVIGISATLTITASLLWIVLLVFGLLVAVSVKATFSYQTAPDSVLYHLADEFEVSLGSGLAGWLFGLPVAAAVAGFLLLVRRPWSRIAYTVLGALTVGWSFWWLRNSVAWWVPAAAYVALAVTICWTPGVGRWYAARRSEQPGPAAVPAR